VIELELIVLIVGCVALFGALLAVLCIRDTSHDAASEPQPGLIVPDRPFEPPTGVTPGLAGPLVDGDVGTKDVRVTLAHLASRGFLRITALTDDHGRGHDWVIRRTDRPADDDLLDYERTLLTVPFGDVSDGASVRMITLSSMATLPERPLEVAQRQLVDELRERGWFHDDERNRHSRWGWTGSILLVIGLLATAYMLIDWLASGDFRGVIGGFLLGAAGILLASRGRRQTQHTDAGDDARTHVTRFRTALADLRPEDIATRAASAEFGRYLPWAVRFGTGAELARAFETEQHRSANWGRPLDIALDWYGPDRAEVTWSPSELVAEVAGFVDGGLRSRAGRRPVAR